MKSRLLAILFILLTASIANAQVKGFIIDSKTKKPLTEVEVFVNGTTHYTISDEAGQFALNELSPGFLDIVLYRKGFRLFKSTIRIQEGKAAILNLALDSEKKEQITKGNAGMERQKFKDVLFGADNACQLINEELLIFKKSSEGIEVKSSEPLIILNNRLGYQIRYHIQKSLLKENIATLSGYFNFQSMTPLGSEQVLRWEKERLKIYKGSLRHLLQSMVNGNTRQEGFEVLDKKGVPLSMDSLITPSKVQGYYKVLLRDSTQVKFRQETKEETITWLIPSGFLEVNDKGILLIPQKLKVIGSMDDAILSNKLPIDYDPEVSERETFFHYYEKIYVHTDKPCYYPGEPIWFKGYINYGEPAWRDSLSKVVYVELINTQNKISLSKMLRVDSGFFHNDFILPDTLRAGTYYLRAYTSLNRNFGDSNLFAKPIPILGITDKVDPVQTKEAIVPSNLLKIITDKPSYKTREKITMTIQLKDSDGKPQAANFSISVTDTEQVISMAEPTIVDNFPMDQQDKALNMEFKYSVEHGISFSGQFLNEKGKPERTMLSIMQWKPRSMKFTETDDMGIFTQSDFDFYDSMEFSFKSYRAKDKPYGSVKLLDREAPNVNFSKNPFSLSVIKTESPQRIIADYEVSNEVRMLEDVIVKGEKIIESKNRSTYGDPDVVIKTEDIKLQYDNLLNSLVGIPGVEVNAGFPGSIVITRAGGLSVYNVNNPSARNSGPLVTIDDVPMSGKAADILATINPKTVARVEITKRLNVLYGSMGAGGVVAVYTKAGMGYNESQKLSNFQSLNVKGYNKSRDFKSPVYKEKSQGTLADYRSTLYWNPEVVTDNKGEASVSFHASDLSGKYRVVVEGVTIRGEPLRSEYSIAIAN